MNPFEFALLELEEIAANSSTLVKQTLLRNVSPYTKRVIAYALDPYKMFGVKKFDMERPLGANMVDYQPEELFLTLDALATRKVTGHAAVNECEFLTEKYAVPAELLSRILNKDLRCGVGATLVNKVFPGLIPEFKVALAREYEPDSSWPKLESIKYDGLRCIAFADESGVTLWTRNGLPITSADHVCGSLYKSWKEAGEAPYAFDGELLEEGGHFQDSSGSIRKKKQQSKSLIYNIFDCIPLPDFIRKISLTPQRQRLETLNSFEYFRASNAPWKIVAHSEVWNDEQVQERYKLAREQNWEGLILKDPEAYYSFKRNDSWTKLKDVKTADVKVTGIELGKGKYAEMVGALVVEFNGQPNRVGTGISDEQRTEWALWPSRIVDHMVEVAYHELTKEGNMRHSRLIKLRPDLE